MKNIVKKINIISITILMILFVWVCTTKVFADPNSSKGFLSYNEEDQKREVEELEKAKEQEKDSTQVEVKSTNNYLKNLEVTGYKITPEFDKQTINYEITNEVDEDYLEINAQVDDEKATISGTGRVALNSGENNLKIEVTSESGTVRTYFIKVVKKVQENLRLTNLKLKAKNMEIMLEPEFDAEIFEYYCNIENEISKVDIEANSSDKNAKIEIEGNEELKPGMNQILISVSSNDGKKVTYRINAYIKENSNNYSTKDYKNIIIIVMGIIIVVLVGIVLKKKKIVKRKH